MKARPAEIVAGAAGVTAFLVMLGLDRAVAAWLALGISAVPGVVTAAVEWWRKRPRHTS